MAVAVQNKGKEMSLASSSDQILRKEHNEDVQNYVVELQREENLVETSLSSNSSPIGEEIDGPRDT